MKITSSADIYKLMKQLLPKKGKKNIILSGLWIIGLDSEQNTKFIEFTKYTAEKFNHVNDSSVWEPHKTTNYNKGKIMVLVETRAGINSNPTKNDLIFSKRQIEMGKPFSIHVLDHLIVVENGYYSMADNGVLGM